MKGIVPRTSDLLFKESLEWKLVGMLCNSWETWAEGKQYDFPHVTIVIRADTSGGGDMLYWVLLFTDS